MYISQRYILQANVEITKLLETPGTINQQNVNIQPLQNFRINAAYYPRINPVPLIPLLPPVAIAPIRNNYQNLRNVGEGGVNPLAAEIAQLRQDHERIAEPLGRKRTRRG